MNTITFRELQRLKSQEILSQLPLSVTVNGKEVMFIYDSPLTVKELPNYIDTPKKSVKPNTVIPAYETATGRIVEGIAAKKMGSGFVPEKVKIDVSTIPGFCKHGSQKGLCKFGCK